MCVCALVSCSCDHGHAPALVSHVTYMDGNERAISPVINIALSTLLLYTLLLNTSAGHFADNAFSNGRDCCFEAWRPERVNAEWSFQISNIAHKFEQSCLSVTRQLLNTFKICCTTRRKT